MDDNLKLVLTKHAKEVILYLVSQNITSLACLVKTSFK